MKKMLHIAQDLYFQNIKQVERDNTQPYKICLQNLSCLKKINRSFSQQCFFNGTRIHSLSLFKYPIDREEMKLHI